MDTFEGLVKPTDPFSEKSMQMHRREVVRFIEVSKHFWSLEAVNYFVAYIISEWTAKFQPEVSESKVVIFPPSKFRDPWNLFMDSHGVRRPQVKSCCPILKRKFFIYIHIYIYIKVKVKWSCYRPVVAQRVGTGTALLFHDCGTRRGWVVSSTPRPHFTPERPGTHFTGGWVGPGAGLEGRKFSSPPGFYPGPSSP